jgi:hypothetical protein
MPMATFFLFAVTAISTGLQLSQSIMMGVWGKPFSPIEGIAFVGALALLVSSYLALFSIRRAVWGAAGSVALLWTAYLPAVVASTPQIGHSSLGEDFFGFVPVFLLGSTTIFAGFKIAGLVKGGAEGASQMVECPWVFRTAVLSVTGLAIAAVVVIEFFFVGIDRDSEQSVSWTIEQVDGTTAAKMTFQNLKGFNYIETEDRDVIHYLQTRHPQNLTVRVSLTYDFGKIRSLNLNYAYLGNLRFLPYIDRKP